MISKTFLDNTLDWQEKTLDQTQFKKRRYAQLTYLLFYIKFNLLISRVLFQQRVRTQ